MVANVKTLIFSIFTMKLKLISSHASRYDFFTVGEILLPSNQSLANPRWSFTRGQTTGGLNFKSYEPVATLIYKAPYQQNCFMQGTRRSLYWSCTVTHHFVFVVAPKYVGMVAYQR